MEPGGVWVNRAFLRGRNPACNSYPSDRESGIAVKTGKLKNRREMEAYRF